MDNPWIFLVMAKCVLLVIHEMHMVLIRKNVAHSVFFWHRVIRSHDKIDADVCSVPSQCRLNV